MTILELTIASIYIFLTVYFIIKSCKYPEQIFGKQYPEDVNPAFIVVWVILTGVLCIGLLMLIPWDMKVF